MKPLTKEELLALTPEEWNKRIGVRPKPNYKAAAYACGVLFVFGTLVNAVANVGTKTASAPQVQQPIAQQPTAEQIAAEQADLQRLNLSNQLRSECARTLRASAKRPESMDIKQDWINGSIDSDFVIIMPYSARNSFGDLVNGSFACHGSNGVITHSETSEG